MFLLMGDDLILRTHLAYIIAQKLRQIFEQQGFPEISLKIYYSRVYEVITLILKRFHASVSELICLYVCICRLESHTDRHDYLNQSELLGVLWIITHKLNEDAFYSDRLYARYLSISFAQLRLWQVMILDSINCYVTSREFYRCLSDLYELEVRYFGRGINVPKK